MNMSKTEKLLAAKKKLKEFQLSKMQHENAPKSQNHMSETQALQHHESKVAQAVHQNNKQAENTTNSNSTTNSNHQSVVNNTNATSGESNVVEYSNLTLSSNVEITKESEEATLITNEPIERPIQNVEASRIVAVDDFSMGQKGHLLEMASQVADVLTNSETVESSLETDLACRNDFMNSYLEEQKKLMNDLHLELNTCRGRVIELEKELAAKDADFQAQLAREVTPLKEQLQAHAQTTGILIAEKAELTSALAQTQQSARQSAEEAEELSTKLRAAQNRIMELEKETAALKANNEGTRKDTLQLRNDYEALEKQFFELKKEKEELYLEASELKQKLNLKKTELMNTQQELQEKTALLSLSELKIQQMKDTTLTEEEGQQRLVLEQELHFVKTALNALNDEKKATNDYYRTYIGELNTQKTELLTQVQSQSKTIEDLQSREESYVQRLSELEQLLQQEREKTEDTQIEELTKEVRELQEANSQNVEVSKLATALESEQLGASRAVSQNQQLKQQLTEMENAFVTLSNAKLDLTEQLQAERSVGHKMNAMLNKVEAEVEDLKRKLQEKEAALMKLEKEKLQNAQIADQMHHYQAQSQHVQTFQQELQNALVRIDRLEKEKRELLGKLNTKEDRDDINEVPQTENSETESQQHNGIDDSRPEVTNKSASLENTEESTIVCNSVGDPVKKLEERFKETMEKVAELTEEKQKLEHLVMQLQSETETIGEYITLYQKQRAVLQSRARDREDAFKQLLEQRNQQQEQLHKMKVLVSNFLTKQVITTNGPTNPIIECQEPEIEKEVEAAGKEVEAETTTTDDKEISELLDLLTEIKDCKDSCIFEPNFHPCPWCSGKLITV